MKKIAILAVDQKNGIGINNQLPWNIPEEMALFKAATVNNIVIMGKNTYLSLKKPLKQRVNIVLSKTLYETEKDIFFEDNETCILFYPTLESFYADLKNNNLTQENVNLFYIGGKQLYENVFDDCDEIYISEIKETYPCDTFIEYDFEEKFQVEEIKDYPDFTFYKLIKKIK